MSGLVIPIKELSPLDLSAVRFAVEYGKRSRARLFFLFVDDPEAAPPDAESVGAERSMGERDSIRESIEALLAREQAQGELTMEVHNRKGDFIQEVRQFIRDNHADEIVVSVSEEATADQRQFQQNIQLLAQMTNCRILTVKPKPMVESATNPG